MNTFRKALLASSALALVTIAAPAQAQSLDTQNCNEMHTKLSEAVKQEKQIGDNERKEIDKLLNEARASEQDREKCITKLREAHDKIREQTGKVLILALVRADEAENDQQAAGQQTGKQDDQQRNLASTQAGIAGGKVVVKQKEPQVNVEQDAPEVDVSQPAPEVTVTQPKPEVIVRQRKPQVNVKQQAPVVTVSQAQPEVIVRIPEPIVKIQMPKPKVDVDTSQPQVSVQQPDPIIRFIRPEPRIVFEGAEADVNVADAQPNVDVSRAENVEANINIERAEPQVRFKSAGEADVNVQQQDARVRVRDSGEADVQVEQSEAEVRIQREGRSDGQNQQQRADAGERENRGSERTSSRQREQENEALVRSASVDEEKGSRVVIAMKRHPLFRERVRSILGEDVYGERGENVGEIENIALRGDRVYAIVSVGGFLGLGEHEVAIPLDRLQAQNDRIVLPRLSEGELEDMPEFDYNLYRILPANRTIQQAYERRGS